MKKLSVLAAAALCSACYDTHVVRPTELGHLDGFDVHNERTIVTPTVSTGPGTTVKGVYHPGTTTYGQITQQLTDRPYRMLDVQGEPVDYDSSRDLSLYVRGQTAPQGGRFASLKVDGDRLEGVLLKGNQVSTRLADLDRAEVSAYNPTKTAWAVAGVGTLLLIPLTAILLHR